MDKMSTTDAESERIEEFMRTHVSRYVLPGKLDAAQRKGAVNVSVPTVDMGRLLANVGEHIAPVEAEEAPGLPAALAALPTELSDLYDWDADGEAIVSREQIEALIGQVVRIAFTTPRPAVRRKTSATVTEVVGAALAAGKRSVTVPVGDLARMLAKVEENREANRPHYTAGDYFREVEHNGQRYKIEVPPSMKAERRDSLAADLVDQIETGRITRWNGNTGILWGGFRWQLVKDAEVAA